MPMTIAMCLLLVSFQSPAASPQERPRFTGEWILVAPEESAAARKLTVAQDASTITVTRVSDTGSEATGYRIGTDAGTVSGTTGNRARTFSAARWMDRSLALSNGTCQQQESLENCVERKETWSIDQKGLLTIELTTYGPGKRIANQAFIYRRPGA